MLEQVLTFINNWFERDLVVTTWEVRDGSLGLPHVREDQYFRIDGSIFNDGLHQYPASDLKDETFTGRVWALAIPQAVIDIAHDIEAWQEKNGEAADSPYSSESFGGYSYSKDGANGAAGSLTGWQKAFNVRLMPYRKL